MSETDWSEPDHIADARNRLLDAALIHVAFDGWSKETLDAAVADTGVDAGLAKLAFPRGGVDMAIAFHDRGDAQLKSELEGGDLSGMGMTAKITHAVRRRLELIAADREAVRRGATLLALPIYAADGSRAIWRTADTIWSVLGDTSTDYNFYTKRATLSAVYSATVLFWLGDDSPRSERTWDFLDRRIANVMQFEKVKAQVKESPIGRLWSAGPGRLAERMGERVAARRGEGMPPMPGTWSG